MNIFFIHHNPAIAAKAMTNTHVVKMILESAQLLSTAHHVLDGSNTKYKDFLYKPTHTNHPSAIWARESSENYMWLYNHFISLCAEYTKRYNKVHLTETKLKEILASLPKNITVGPQTPPRLAIKNTDWHQPDPIKSYRSYYENEKLKLEVDILRYNNIIKGEIVNEK